MDASGCTIAHTSQPQPGQMLAGHRNHDLQKLPGCKKSARRCLVIIKTHKDFGEKRASRYPPKLATTRRWSKALLGTVLGATVASCGDPIVDSRYPGAPLLSVQGEIEGYQENGANYPLRASLFWSPSGTFDASSMRSMHEDNSVKVNMEFPSSFTLSVYRPPRPEWMVPGKGYAVGAVLVYEDTLGQGNYVPGRTPLRGGVLTTAIFYAPKEIAQAQSPFNTTIGPGMMDLSLPLPCGSITFPEPSQKSSPSCDPVALGAPCKKNAECGSGGTCLSTLFDIRLNNGYCAQKVVPGCQPANAVAVAVEALEEKLDETDSNQAYYLRACNRDNDCGRTDGYRCDPFTRACLPTVPVVLEFGTGLTLRPFCEKNDVADTSTTGSNDDIPEDVSLPSLDQSGALTSSAT